MRLIVQKFGGSSLTTHEMRLKAVDHIRAAGNEGYSPLVVVSAMGRQGDPFATDTLLKVLYDISPTPPLRELDLLISCGEIISATVMVTELADSGVKAVALTGAQAGIITDGNYGYAEILRIKKERILRLAADGQVVVIAGFQGASKDGEINTLGRGGSDTTAVAVGAALEAEMVEIYSDVDSVMTADPRIVPEARPIRNLGYQEILQLAREGAKVIHPRAVDIAQQFNLPILLKRTGDPTGGTLVSHKKGQDEHGFIARERVVNGITHVAGLAQVRLQEPRTDSRDLEALLTILAERGVSIDLISFSPQERLFTVPSGDAQRVSAIISELGYKGQVRTGFAKVTVVGTGMRGIPGVMARIVCALNQAGTSIMQTADSHLNISCLVPEKDVSNAVKALHMEFGLGE